MKKLFTIILIVVFTLGGWNFTTTKNSVDLDVEVISGKQGNVKKSDKTTATVGENTDPIGTDFNEDELVICFDGKVDEKCIKDTIKKVGQDYEILVGEFEIDENLPEHKKERLQKYLDEGKYNTIVNVDLKKNVNVDEAMEALEKKEKIIDMDYNYTVEEQAYGVDDPYSSNQYYLKNIKAKTAWDTISKSGYRETWIAQIDTGVCLKNPDFSNVYLKQYSVDVTTSDSGNYTKLKDMVTPYDGAHGTLTSGVAIAKANNGKGIAGVGSYYDNTICKLMAIKATDAGGFTTANIIKAIQYAIAHGADVINMSFSGDHNSYDSMEQEAINSAYNAGIVVVAAMGNQSSTGRRYPADYENVISVSATDKNNKIASFSNYGHEDICAPGDNICTTGIEESNSYTTVSSGTSLAAPMVSATIAMMRGINTELSTAELENILYITATDLGDSYKYGNGLLNTGYAVQMAKYKGLRTEDVKIKSITTPSTGKIKIKWNEIYYGEGYCISRSTSKNGTYKRVGVTTNESFTDTGLKSGKKYYYRVRAYMGYQAGGGTVNGKTVGYSTYSNIVNIKAK